MNGGSQGDGQRTDTPVNISNELRRLSINLLVKNG
jgi:hypothetical protein